LDLRRKTKFSRNWFYVVQVIFLACLIEGGGFGAPDYNITVVRSVMSDYVLITAEKLSSSGSVAAWADWEIRLSGCNRHTVWCAVTGVIKSIVMVQIIIVGRI
jgi:hypothetical protein